METMIHFRPSDDSTNAPCGALIRGSFDIKLTKQRDTIEAACSARWGTGSINCPECLDAMNKA